jgi:hypothetical protein
MKLFAFIFFALASIACAAIQNFDLVNESGSTISDLYLARPGENWSDNILLDDLEDGNTVLVRFSNDEDTIWWRVRIKFADGDYFSWPTQFNLLKVYRITVQADSDGKYHLYYQYYK